MCAIGEKKNRNENKLHQRSFFPLLFLCLLASQSRTIPTKKRTRQMSVEEKEEGNIGHAGSHICTAKWKNKKERKKGKEMASAATIFSSIDTEKECSTAIHLVMGSLCSPLTLINSILKISV
jgi:hypothetical protein